MDGAANWRPTLGDGPAAIADAGGVDPNAAAPAGGDWRTQLQPEQRNRIVNMLMETLKKHLPVPVPEGLGELHKIAVRFEEKIYTAAINQSDYLRKIALKVLSMESQTNTQQNPGNAQVISNQNPPGPGLLVDLPEVELIEPKELSQEALEDEVEPHSLQECPNHHPNSFEKASADSTDQTAPPCTGDLQELYQMIKNLKDQYFVEMNDLYNKVSIKIQHIDNHMPSQKSAEQYEKMNGFKVMLERMLHFLQVNKSSIQPDFRKKIPIYERQIQSILSSKRRKPVQAPGPQTFQQSASVDSASQTGHPGAGDLQEELYQMIKNLKDQYFVELNDLYNKVSIKIQHIDNHMPSQKSAEQYEKMNGFKVMLERMLHFLQVNKSSIQPGFRKKIPIYERQIQSILSSQRRKPVQAPGSQTFQQSASVDSAAQTGHPGAGDLQEELYQMIKSLKDQYFVGLNDLYNKISIKIQRIDNHMPSQKSTEQYEKMKSFKVMLERTLHFLQVNKSSIQPGFREKISIYERHILSILSLQRRKPSGGPALSSNISQQHQDSQGLQQHDSHTNQKPQASLPSSSSKGKKRKNWL